MILGRFHERFPRVVLSLPGRDTDEDVDVEFIIDTGFDGYLSVPGDLVRRLEVEPFGPQTHMVADGSQVECPVCYVSLLWNAEARETELLVLGRNPLMGTLFLEGCHLDVDFIEGGEVIIEP